MKYPETLPCGWDGPVRDPGSNEETQWMVSQSDGDAILTGKINCIDKETAFNLFPELVEALQGITELYIRLAASGDCGNWDPEEDPEVIKARELLAKIEQ